MMSYNELCKDYLKLSNKVESDFIEFLAKRFARLPLKIMEQRYDSKERDASGIFLLLLMICCIKNCVDKKRICRNQWQFKKNYIDGYRAANIHIIYGVTTSETSVLDGAIRDNYPVRLGLGNFKDENFKMVFGITKDDSIIHVRVQGYISINDVLDGHESPWVTSFLHVRSKIVVIWGVASWPVYSYRATMQMLLRFCNWKIM